MLFRVYIDKTDGNEHVRCADFEAADEQAATPAAEALLEEGESLGQVVRLHDDTPPMALEGAVISEEMIRAVLGDEALRRLREAGAP